MRLKKFTFCAIFLLGFGLVEIKAQESIITTGGSASGSGGSVSSSIGQVVYTTYAEANGSVAQGVQQPYEIYVATGIEESNGISLIITAYPNPASDYLKLRIDNIELSNVYYQMYDMQGNLLKNGKITNNQTSIVMNNLAPASYFVKVFQGNKEVKTFKVIKH